jgi:hypothetical protein
MLGFVPAENTSNLFPPDDRRRPSAIWLRAEFPVQRMSTRFFIGYSDFQIGVVRTGVRGAAF